MFEEGHRIALRLSGSDDDWFSPPASMTQVTVTGGSLELPLLRYERTEFLDGGPSDGMDGATFTVPASTLDEATVETDPPPAQEHRIPAAP